MKLVFLSVILILTFNLQIASAEVYSLDITAELIDGEGKIIKNLNEIPLNQNLGLHLQLINSNNFWINTGSLQLNFKTTKNGEKFFPLTSSLLRDDFLLSDIYIPPNDKTDINVILENYNSLDENDRSGSWEIHFDVYSAGIDCFYSVNFEDMNYVKVEAIKPNNIVFEARNEIPKLDKKSNLPNISDVADKLTPVNVILAFFISSLTLVGLIMRFKK